jgi:hypothetical protein
MASLPVIAAVRVVAGVNEVQVAGMGFDRCPVIAGLQDRFVLGVGLGAVPGDEDGLGHRGVDVLQDREEQRGAPRVTHQHRVLVEAVVGQHLGQERGDGLYVEAGVVRYLEGVPPLGQSPAQPRIPAALRVPARSVEDDGVSLHRTVLPTVAAVSPDP